MPPTEKQIAYAKSLGIEANFAALSRHDLSRLIEQRKCDIENGKAERPSQLPRRQRRQSQGDGYEQWGEDAAWIRYQERDRDY